MWKIECKLIEKSKVLEYLINGGTFRKIDKRGPFISDARIVQGDTWL